MKPQWTPGPWVAFRDDLGWHVNVAENDPNEATVRLIAAAPEMAEVLQRIAAGMAGEKLRPFPPNHPLVSLAREVLNRVTAEYPTLTPPPIERGTTSTRSVPYATGGPDFHSHLDDKHEFHGHAAAIRVCSKCRAELADDIQRLVRRLAEACSE